VTRSNVTIVADRWLLRRVARPVLALVGALLWTGETALTATFGGQIQEERRRVSNQRERASVRKHTIVCGYGMFGRTVATRAHQRDREVVVIESDPAQYERVLQDADVDRTSSLVAAIDSNANTQIALLATQLAPDLTVVVRVGDKSYESVARHAGADAVIIPEVAGGERVLDQW